MDGRARSAGRAELEERPGSFEALRTRLDELSRQYEPIVRIHYAADLVRPREGTLAVGMGGDAWMLTYFPPNDDVPKNSLGDIRADGTVSFFFGDHTLVSRKYLVPKAAALDAIRSWWERGEPGESINWTTNIY